MIESKSEPAARLPLQLQLIVVLACALSCAFFSCGREKGSDVKPAPLSEGTRDKPFFIPAGEWHFASFGPQGISYYAFRSNRGQGFEIRFEGASEPLQVTHYDTDAAYQDRVSVAEGFVQSRTDEVTIKKPGMNYYFTVEALEKDIDKGQEYRILIQEKSRAN